MGTSPKESLPIHDCLSDILRGLIQSRSVVLKAPPGAGKTTGVPPAILGCQELPPGQILLAQPRRLAARTAAAQLARLVGGELGETVGYHVRFDRRESKQTRLLVLTYGMLLRRLQSDPLLEGVSCVLLDEFHERSLESDLALGMITRVRREFRDDLRLVVMSATLQSEPLVAFLGDANAVTSEGRMYPVEVHYRPAHSRESIVDQVTAVLAEAISATDGHLLVFLPGVGEIQRTQRAIESTGIANDCEIHQLYADLPVAEQDRVLRQSSRRKIILATNVAETSITIDGVTGVIDSGQARTARFEPNVGLPRLSLESISQASAEQRAGRAGRTQPGVCWRLWHASAHRGRAALDAPEILRADFAPAALVLATWGENDSAQFPWLDPPRKEAVEQANELLRRLGAVDDEHRITPLGEAMSQLPVHPRLAKLLVIAAEAGVIKEAAIASALLTERDPFRSSSSPNSHGRGNERQGNEHGGDMLEAIERVGSSLHGQDRSLRISPAMRQIDRVVKQLVNSVRELKQSKELGNKRSVTVLLTQAMLAAFPDRVARRREIGGDTAVMVGGKGVRLSGIPALRDCEWLLCLKVDSIDGDARVSLAASIEKEWLDEKWLRVVDEPLLNESTGSLVARRREYFLDLLLSETPIQCKRSPQSGELLAAKAKAIWGQSQPPENEALQSLLARIEFLRRVLGPESLPAFDESWFDETRLTLATKCLSIDELSRSAWVDCVRDHLDYAHYQLIEREAPGRMRVPSGNEITIQYEFGKPPMMAVKLQELFGWHDTPRIARGRVPIQFHLLGPNRRTQQITDDLRRFWETTYVQVRKDLRARYPKHFWPEDPFVATATRNGMKPRV